jgi:hypothetical protein
MEPVIEIGQIEVLRRRLLQDADLSQFWDYYFTNFAENPRFTTMGDPSRNELLEEALGLVARKLFGRDAVRVNDLLLIEIPQFQLIHGSCSIDGCFAGVLYFPDMKAGVIAIVMGQDGQMMYARITAHLLESLAPPTSTVQ